MTRPLPAFTALLLLLLPNASPVRSQEAPRRIAAAEQVQVNLVLIDVVVRDRKDRPVSGLTKEDFELLVDRLPVPPSEIESFEEICAPPDDAPSIAQASTQEAARTREAGFVEEATQAAPRHIVIFLDFSHLSLSGRRQALRAARDHLATQLAPSDRVMILAFKSSLRLVQEFTSDSAALTSRFDEMIADTTTLDSDVLEESQQMYDVARKPCDVSGNECLGRLHLASAYAVQEEQRARRALKALEHLMPALAGIRGRKALVLFTDSLRDEPGIEYIALARSTPQRQGIKIDHDMLRLTKEANAAGVSIYTVHASGLDDRLIEQFRDARPENTAISGDGGITSTGAGIETVEAARSGLDSALSLQTMLATETGGRALQRTNELGRILTTAQQDLSCHYLLGYRHPGRGDDQRHSLIVKIRPDPSGESRRGLTVRHRPYYTDASAADRRARQIRSAIEAPDLYKALPVTAEAFALAPQQSGRGVLIKASIPLDALSLLPASNSILRGRAFVAGEVWSQRESQPVCSFEHEIPLEVARDGHEPSALVFETGCVLAPGAYDLSVVVLDPTSLEIGARRTNLSVQAVGPDRPAFVGEVQLWAREPSVFVATAGAEKIGIKGSAGIGAFIPRSERRLRKDQEGVLSFLLCPSAESLPRAGSPIRVHRTLQGEGDATVADFRDLMISEPPDSGTGCYQITNSIPANTLGDGVYKFTVRLSGPAFSAPLTREAALAVN